MANDNLLEAALQYASWGWHVFPLVPNTKIPHAGTSGYHEATTDPKVIKAWWNRWPGSNIGLACRPSGIVVVDIDVKRGDGYATWGELQGRLGFSTETPTSFTPSGGCHLFYRLDPQVEVGQGTLGANVDLKWNGYALLPPSRLDERPGQVAGVYKWDPMLHPGELEPLPLPEPLLGLLARQQEKPQAERPQVGLLEELPKVVAALRKLSPARCDDYNGWLQVGMALRELGDVGLALWDEWSRQSGKWEPGVCAKKWATLEPAKGITLGSLFHWAREDGGGEDWEESEGIWIPPLPEELTAAEADASNEWLDTYVDYALQVSPMTPRLFHEAAGLWLGAVAIARRLYIRMPHALIYPNLYILWVAPTTLFAKTTGVSVAEGLARDALNHLLLPQEVTPEALLSELAGKDPPHLDELPQEVRDLWQQRRNFAAQRGLLLDEFSGLLAFAKKDYNLGLTEYLLRWHDCPPQWVKRTQSQGLTVVRHAYFSILSTTTPAALAPYLTEKGWLSGFWPRFALLYPETNRPPFRRVEEVPTRPAWLLERLTRLANEALPIPTYPASPQARPVEIDPDARMLWECYDKAMRYDLLISGDVDECLWGWYGRLPAKALKIATILAALDWDGDGSPAIEISHMARAIEIAENWRASLHRLLSYIEEKAGEALRPDLYYRRRILEIVREHGGEMPRRELFRRLGSNEAQKAKWGPAYSALLKEGRMQEVAGPKPERGRVPIYVKIGNVSNCQTVKNV